MTAAPVQLALPTVGKLDADFCAVEGCGKPRLARGYCSTHYARWRQGRDIDAPVRIAGAPKPECAIDGCSRTSYSRGWCALHYTRWWRNGSHETLYEPVLDRIVGRSEIDPDGCWVVVTGSFTSNGYGLIDVGGRKRGVHRVAYELLVGPVPAGLDLDHLCRVRNCWRPDHLEPVTRRENVQRGWWVQRTACIHGHEFTEANTRWMGNTRVCLTCERLAGKRARERARALRSSGE